MIQVDSKTIQDLERLTYYVKSLDIPDRNKTKIINTITFEKALLNTNLFLQKEKEK